MTKFLVVLAVHQLAGAMLFLRAIIDGWIALALFGAVWVAGGVWVARIARSDAVAQPSWVTAVVSVTATVLAMMSVLGAGHGVGFLLCSLALIVAGLSPIALARRE